MKKLLFLAVLIGFAFSNVNAQEFSSRGYRCFADLGYTAGVGDYKFGRIEVNTSHGYQINPYLFVGAGLGLHFMQSYQTNGSIPLDIRDSKVDIPIFANVRCNFKKTKVAPFIDAKAGTFITNGDGLYANISGGCRIAVNGKQAIDLSLGYTYEKLQFETFDHFLSPYSMDYSRESTIYQTEGITLKVGYEF